MADSRTPSQTAWSPHAARGTTLHPPPARAYEQRTGMSMILDDELRAMLEDAGFIDVTLPPGTWNVFATAHKPEAS